MHVHVHICTLYCGYLHIILLSGVILFSENDLHHADFWCKSNDQDEVLDQFSESWRWVGNLIA